MNWELSLKAACNDAGFDLAAFVQEAGRIGGTINIEEQEGSVVIHVYPYGMIRTIRAMVPKCVDVRPMRLAVTP